MVAIERILVPIDFSESSLKTLAEAVEFNHRMGRTHRDVRHGTQILRIAVVWCLSLELFSKSARSRRETGGNLQKVGCARRQMPDASGIWCRFKRSPMQQKRSRQV